MQLFNTCFNPKKGMGEKLNIPVYTRKVKAPNKKMASLTATVELYKDFPEIAEHYCDAKVCEDRVGLSSPALDNWDTGFLWNKETSEIELNEPTAEDNTHNTTTGDEPEFIDTSKLSTNEHAALLALFGRIDRITKAEYSQAIDLTNDDMPSFERELGEAIARTKRVLALLPERQAALLASTRDRMKKDAQWPEIKKFLDSQLDIPPEKRDTPVAYNAPASVSDAVRQGLRTPSGAVAGGLNQTDRGPGFVMTLDTLAMDVALGLVGRTIDFDIYNPPVSIVNRAREIINTKEKPFPNWYEAWRSMPYGMDYSRAATVYSVKCAPENIELRPGTLLGYLNNVLTETDHQHPSAEIVAAACGIKLQVTDNNEDATEQSAQNSTNVLVTDNSEVSKLAEDAAGDGEPTQEVRPDDTRASMSEREIEIAHAINALLSGCTNVMAKEEAEGVVSCTGHLIPDVSPSLIADIAATEFCLSPDFSDEEIHQVVTSILDAWSDNEAKRQIVALDAITEWRTELPLPAIIEKPVVMVKPHPEPEETPVAHAATSHGLTYHQQLTIAALQGLCANPACFGCFEDIASMATSLASSISPEVSQ